MRDSRIVTVVLLAWLASGEAFLAWSNPAGKITARRKDLAHYFSSILEGSPSTSRETCLYLSPDLPDCDFDRSTESAEGDDSSGKNYHRLYEHSGENVKRGILKSLPDQQGTSESDGGEGERGRVVVYTIEGCLPARLPFDMPLCKNDDLVDKVFDVRKLYPFRVKGSSLKETFVFPEFNLGQWLKMMRRFEQRPVPPTEADEQGMKGAEGTGTSGQRERVLIRATKRKTTIPRATSASTYVSKGSPSSNVIVHDEPARNNAEDESNLDLGLYPEENDRLVQNEEDDDDNDRLVLLEFRPLDKADTRGSFYNAKNNEEDQWEASKPVAKETAQEVAGNSEDVTDQWSPRWFAEPSNNLPAQAEPEVPANPFHLHPRSSRTRREVIREGSEFPYAKAIPFDPKKLGAAYGQQARKSRESPRFNDIGELPAVLLSTENFRAKRSAEKRRGAVDSRRRLATRTTRKNRKKYSKTSLSKRPKGKHAGHLRQ